MIKATRNRILSGLILFTVVLNACQPLPLPAPNTSENTGEGVQAAELQAPELQADSAEPLPDFTPRPNYQPAEPVDYTAQTGDTLAALATRFNTTVKEILQANEFIPATATTMPPGMPMKIPIYYLPFWGSQYQILPDSLFVNGPAAKSFDTAAFIATQPGWLNGHKEFVSGATRTAAQIIDLIAQNYSIDPRLLLAMLEYQGKALTLSAAEANIEYPLGHNYRRYRGLYLQLSWAANLLNQGYYAWRRGAVVEFNHSNGRVERPDPWQNAATVALQNYFLRHRDQSEYNTTISRDGFAATYRQLFGDPWANVEPHIPGSLSQPDFILPFERGKSWSYTGGPHTGWGSGEPLAAVDFAPPSVVGGCQESNEWATAMAGGVVVRSEVGIVELDLDGDGDGRTGWSIFYLHVGSEGRAQLGAELQAGQPLGHPSCEGGSSTGTHVHIARKYNGEWMLAEGPLGFTMEGWVVYNGNVPYQGTLRRFSQTIKACDCSNLASQITAGQ